VKRSDSLPMTLHPSRLRAILYLLFAMLLAALGLWIEHPVGAAFFLTFSAVGLLVSGMQLVPSLAYLQLTQEGFSYRWGWNHGSVGWSEVDRFDVREAPGWYSRSKFVEWIYVRRYEKLPSTTGRRYSFGGGSGVLPDAYGMKAEELSDLMNDFRKRYGQVP
jgi:hypothetical protein